MPRVWRRPRTSLRSPGAADHTIESGGRGGSSIGRPDRPSSSVCPEPNFSKMESARARGFA